MQRVKRNGASRNRHKGEQGFTLIELIVVVAILGVLAAVLVPSLSGYVGTAKAEVANANARTVYVAAQTISTEVQVGKAQWEEGDFASGNKLSESGVAKLKEKYLGADFDGVITVVFDDAHAYPVSAIWKPADNATAEETGYYPPKKD